MSSVPLYGEPLQALKGAKFYCENKNRQAFLFILKTAF